MSITLENCGILREDILNGLIDKLAEPLEDEISSEASRLVSKKLDELVDKKVETVVTDAITAKINQLMASEIQPLNVWGEKRGKPRTINDILSDSLKEYWSVKVDNQGKPTDSWSSKQTRVEYTVKKIAADVLNDKTSKEFNQLILNAKAQLSDSLTKAVKKVADAHLDIKRK